MPNILLDTTPLHNQNAGRGVGVYTRLLRDALEQRSDIELLSPQQVIEGEAKPDLVHYPFFDLFFPTLPLFQRKPVVVTIHDVIPLLFPKEYPVGVRGKLAFARQWLALRNVAAVITDSDASKNDIVRKLGVPANQVYVVSLAADPALQPSSAAQQRIVRERFKLPEKYILYVGDINYNKNIPQLIKMLKFLPDSTHLVCIGRNFVPQQIPEWQAIERQIALSDVTARVQFITDLGAAAQLELAALYQNALVYVQPSLYEGFGLPVLEAMQCGVPVVAAANSSLLEVGGETAIFAEPTAEALAEAVKTVHDWTTRQRNERIRQGESWAATFTWQKTAAATVAVYEKVLRKREEAVQSEA